MADVFSLDNAKEKLEALDAFIDAQVSKKDGLIAVLHRAQDLFGYLPSELQLYVARKLNIPASKVYGVVSFYSYFTQEKRGEFTVSVCMGTACFVKGVDKVVDEFTKQLGVKFGETTPDGLFTMNDVRCIGACGLAPVVMINDKVFGHVKASDVANIIETCKNSERSE
ncbi:NADH-quinone oxidoreductase subunit NuoE family protein [Fusibacter ferrireducens]|uniref:NAD(P)H-dependent oxidoreductase subunit E n=1 Tax=Fusibacter ferrireducens TaxID=2785058 RepID=A0ABR9ZSR5_9FIRM|nr:NAD(P)H-dependent oxidoreductase subunit E [Fusibacter ferrireducens]MBF4693001.1 NAD(P)H-dependent oxidoreductase subunit E [Fusibacter ferrireducens]